MEEPERTREEPDEKTLDTAAGKQLRMRQSKGSN